jgi:hypothetical protein
MINDILTPDQHMSIGQLLIMALVGGIRVNLRKVIMGNNNISKCFIEFNGVI